jgi:hypothetical protein
MRRFTSVIIFILLGALAVGIGMGLILKKANDDRERLADIALQAQQASRKAQEAQAQAVIDANKKVEDANSQVTQAQQALKDLQQERDAIAQATPLLPPAPKLTRGWKQAISVDLGVSCLYPTGNEEKENDATALLIANEGSAAKSETMDTRWLQILSYSSTTELGISSYFSTSTPVSYLVDGHLLTGFHGSITAFFPGFSPAEDVFILHVQKSGITTHTIWIKNPVGINTDGGLAVHNVLSTLSFQK